MYAELCRYIVIYIEACYPSFPTIITTAKYIVI
jgi:hypothetical protein